MAQMINFEPRENKTNKIDATEICMDIYEKVMEMKDKMNSYDKDEMVDVKDWDGDCWEAFFNKVVKDLAKMYDLNPWDVLIVFMHEFLMDKGE